MTVSDTPSPAPGAEAFPDLSTVDGLAAALRYAGVEIGYTGGEAFRVAAAQRLLPLVQAQSRAVWAAAYRQGVEDQRHCEEVTGGAVAPNRANPYEAAQ